VTYNNQTKPIIILPLVSYEVSVHF